ncbi:kell blood group glycoprotein-like [Amblyomma americanum]
MGIQGTEGVRIVSRPADCSLGNWIKVVLLPVLLVFAATGLIYMTTTYWMRIQRGYFWRTSPLLHRVKNSDIPLLPYCDSMACKTYRSLLKSSVNRSQNPCKDFYRFVCDGWRKQHRVLSVVDAAQDTMYTHALNEIENDPGFAMSKNTAAASVPNVRKRIADLVASCVQYSRNSLHELKIFLAERHLPWPATSPRDLLEILLDFSGKWNLHLWFQMTLDLAPYRSGTGEPLLKIANSAKFRAWIALMRAMSGQRKETQLSLRYRKYIRSVLGLFGVSESRAEQLASAIQEMDRLTLDVLGPAMADPEQKILRMSIQNMAATATPGIPTGRWLQLLNEYFAWARLFSATNEVQLENPGLLRAVAYLRGRKAETREALTLSLGLRVVTELGWMADKEIADGTLQLMDLPWSAHTRRCLVEVEINTGVAWSSLFPRHQGVETLVQNVRDILVSDVMRRSNATLQLSARKGREQWDIESYLVNLLPDPNPGPSFFIIWKSLMNIQWRLQQRGLNNVIRPRSVLSHTWSIYGALTASEEFFVFPLYHPELPPAVNYGGAGRLLADEVLRVLFYEPFKGQQQVGQYYYVGDLNEGHAAISLPEWSPFHVDTRALLAAWKAYRQDLQRHSTDVHSGRSSRLADDRLFFVASCYALCSSGYYMGELDGDASRRCNVATEALWEFRTAFQCDNQKD